MPLAWLWSRVLWLRHRLYDTGRLKSHAFSVPVIDVGNLQLGGTGKTPMTEYLIRLLRDDFKIAVLSRGYKRRSKGYLEADEHATPALIGDEPYQIHRKFGPEVIVAVDTDRVRGVQNLLKRHRPGIIILDDAFQHRRIRARVDLLLTPFHRPFFRDRLIPAGRLRDLPARARQASVILVTKTPESASVTEKQNILRALQAYRKPVFFTGLRYGPARTAREQTCSLIQPGARILLVTGIADAEPLLQYLHKQGIQVDHLSFADHRHYGPAALNRIRREWEAKDYDGMLTTEKDFVKLQLHFPGICYLPVEVSIENEQHFKNWLYEQIKSRKPIQ